MFRHISSLIVFGLFLTIGKLRVLLLLVFIFAIPSSLFLGEPGIQLHWRAKKHHEQRVINRRLLTRSFERNTGNNLKANREMSLSNCKG